MEELPLEAWLGDAVHVVAYDREADRAQMHADLVHPAGFEPHPEEGVRRQQFEHLEVRDSVARRVGVQRLPGRIGAVSSDRRLDLPTLGARPAAHECDVAALELALPHEVLEPAVRLFASRDDEEAGRVTVEPVDDARSLGLAAGRSMRGERLDERARRATRPGMHDQPGGLVHHQKVLILVGDPQAVRCRAHGRLCSRRAVDLQLLPTLEPVALGPRTTVEPDSPARHQPLGLATRADLREPGQEAVEALARRLGRNAKSYRAVRQSRRPRRGARSAAASASKRIATPMTMKVSARLKAGQ